jgi:hypothetical protein
LRGFCFCFCNLNQKSQNLAFLCIFAR